MTSKKSTAKKTSAKKGEVKSFYRKYELINEYSEADTKRKVANLEKMMTSLEAKKDAISLDVYEACYRMRAKLNRNLR